MRFQSYFNTALQLIGAYDGSMPLAHYLKQYFAQHKKHGSKDRKYISHLCYCYYRLGHALKDITIEERLRVALFLCTGNIEEWAVLFDEPWPKHYISLRERTGFVQSIYPFDIIQIFPWQNELSDGIEATAFSTSHLIQPDLFLRARPGEKNTVVQKLQAQNIPFTPLGENAFALPNITKIDTVLTLNKEVVVQDYSSQQVQKFFQFIKTAINAKPQPVTVWDCCAASGGKSIMVYDSFGNIDLTVSDIRPSIINNLNQRFKKAGIEHYKSFIADLSNAPPVTHPAPFDVVICDAPCTGSGTWGRTPEQLYFFHPEKIMHYSTLQKRITQNVMPHIKTGGYLLYITCSVFKQENELIVDAILHHKDVTLIAKEILNGYDKKADTMFAALFKK